MPDLSDGVNWSEVDANNNNPAPNGWPEGMMPSGVNDAARADRGALKRFWDKINPVQTITPSGGVYTFTTTNLAYPTAYVDGEIYGFRSAAASVGGDFFQVNALDPKPIWKRVVPGPTGWAPIIALDILAGGGTQLTYQANLNAGDGAFILLNAFVPIHGDGVGGLSTTGTLTVMDGDLKLGRTDQAYGYVTRPPVAGINNLAFAAAGGGNLNDVQVLTNQMEVTGRLSATGYSSRSGVSGTYQSNLFNIQWTGSTAHLWIDNIDAGPIAIAGGPVNVGTVNTGTLTVTGNASIGGQLTAASASISGQLTAASASIGGQLTAASANVTGNATVGGTLNVNGLTTTASINASSLNTSGNIQCNSNMSVAGTLGVTGALTTLTDLTISGRGIINAGLYVTGAYSGDIGGHTIWCNGALMVVSGARVDPPAGQAVALTVNGGIDVHPSGGDCMHAFGNVDIDGNLTVGTLNGHPAMDMFTQLDALAARVQALEEQLR